MVTARFMTAALGAVIALSAATVACGGGSETKVPEIPAGALVVPGVANLLFGQKAYSATAVNGAVTIAFRNDDTIRHTLVIIDADRIRQGPTIEVQKRGDVAIGTYNLAPGQYTIVCDVPGHSATMNATLTVS